MEPEPLDRPPFIVFVWNLMQRSDRPIIQELGRAYARMVNVGVFDEQMTWSDVCCWYAHQQCNDSEIALFRIVSEMYFRRFASAMCSDHYPVCFCHATHLRIS